MGGPVSVQPASTPVADTGFLALRFQFITYYADGTVQHVNSPAIYHPATPTAYDALAMGRYDLDATRLRAGSIGTNATDAVDGCSATNAYSAFPNCPHTTADLDGCR